MSQEIRCRKCGRVMAVDHGDYIEIIKGASAARFYHSEVASFDCERCGSTTELPTDKRRRVTV